MPRPDVRAIPRRIDGRPWETWAREMLEWIDTTPIIECTAAVEILKRTEEVAEFAEAPSMGEGVDCLAVILCWADRAALDPSGLIRQAIAKVATSKRQPTAAEAVEALENVVRGANELSAVRCIETLMLWSLTQPGGLSEYLATAQRKLEEWRLRVWARGPEGTFHHV